MGAYYEFFDDENLDMSYRRYRKKEDTYALALSMAEIKLKTDPYFKDKRLKKSLASYLKLIDRSKDEFDDMMKSMAEAMREPGMKAKAESIWKHLDDLQKRNPDEY